MDINWKEQEEGPAALHSSNTKQFAARSFERASPYSQSDPLISVAAATSFYQKGLQLLLPKRQASLWPSMPIHTNLWDPCVMVTGGLEGNVCHSELPYQMLQFPVVAKAVDDAEYHNSGCIKDESTFLLHLNTYSTMS